MIIFFVCAARAIFLPACLEEASRYESFSSDAGAASDVFQKAPEKEMGHSRTTVGMPGFDAQVKKTYFFYCVRGF